MGIAIVTKFHGPTNTRGSRYSASAGGNLSGKVDRVTGSSNHAHSPIRNRAILAEQLATKLDLSGVWFAAGLDGSEVIFARMPVSDELSRKIADQMNPAGKGEDWFYVAPAPVYYVERVGDALELRQTRFIDQRQTRNGAGHAHDVCAVAMNRADMERSAALLGGGVDWRDIDA